MNRYITLTPQNDRTPVHGEEWQAESEEKAWDAVKARLVPYLEEELVMSGSDWWYVECEVQMHEIHDFQDEDGDWDCEEEFLGSATVTGYRALECDRCNKTHLPAKDGYSDCDHACDRCRDHPEKWVDQCGCWWAKQEMEFREEDKALTLGEIAVKRGDITQEELDEIMESVGGFEAVTAKLAALSKEATG